MLEHSRCLAGTIGKTVGPQEAEMRQKPWTASMLGISYHVYVGPEVGNRTQRELDLSSTNYVAGL